MNKKLAAALLAGSLSLTACASVDDARMSDVGTGAAVGAAGGALIYRVDLPNDEVVQLSDVLLHVAIVDRAGMILTGSRP